MKKPSDFIKHPWSCVFMSNEHESIAVNIMVILKRTGNEWRSLTFEEYETERKKDGGYSRVEKAYFDDVSPYTYSADKAAIFSETWKDIFEN